MEINKDNKSKASNIITIHFDKCNHSISINVDDFDPNIECPICESTKKEGRKNAK